MKIYIMAQGRGNRWIDASYPYKQMIQIGGEPNLMRTLRFLNEMGQTDYTVVAPKETFTDRQLAKFPDKLLTLPNPTRLPVDIAKLIPDKGAIFLLGDVIFSRRMLKAILENEVFTRTYFAREIVNPFCGKVAKEIFALRIPADEVESTRYWLMQSTGEKLWSTLHVDYSIMSLLNDYTDDLDSPQEVDEFYAKLEAVAKLDN